MDRRVGFPWIAATMFAAGVSILTIRALDHRLARTDHLTGWLLIIALLGLMALGLRKKLPFLPLGRAALWLRAHLSLGVLAAVLFGLHVGVRVPSGPLEICLWILFVVVTLSGVLGTFLSRSFARRLTARGAEVLWERIPMARRRIREEAEELVQRTTNETGSSAISEFYLTRLASFLAGPKHLWGHVVGSERARRKVLLDFETLDPYTNDAEHEVSGALKRLVMEKDDLDFHWALQGVLKAWLFIHIPATWALLTFAALHALVAEAFSAGLR